MAKITAAMCAAIAIGLSASTACANSVQDKFQITAEEMSACGSDAIALCSSAYPDEAKLLYCMKQNRVSLSATCRPVFDAGVRRRHL
jgi:hypothetical protein